MSYTILRAYQARRDLENISQYTHDVWGETQLRTYMTELEVTIQMLADQPETQAQNESQYRPWLRSASHKNHYFVFYRVKGQSVELLRVLHQRRNSQSIMLEK